jgi:arylformamidase
MVIEIEHNNKKYKTDLTRPIDISLPLKNGSNNPNCYYANDVEFTTIKSGDFVGSVKEGGSVNYMEVRITPHGNGTHTEGYGHLSSDSKATVNTLLKEFHFVTEVLTITPKKINGDYIVRLEDYLKVRKHKTEVVVIRTLPNDVSKKIRKYSGTNPPYLDHKITALLNETGVKHLLIDLPSLDREEDEGKLLAHRAFWGMPDSLRKDCTVTELIFVEPEIEDGLYLLNLQVINMEIDASPSRPLLFKLYPS